MKVLIIEDKPTHYDLMQKGIKELGEEYEIVEIDIDIIIKMIKNKDFSKLPGDIDLFIVDVCLEKDDELGLLFVDNLIRSKYRKGKFKFIVSSVWDRDEFETELDIKDNQFINKNDFDGFELTLELRNKVFKLCGK